MTRSRASTRRRARRTRSINAEGTAQQLSRTVLDLAGNTTTASSPPVKIDLTPPVTTASAVPTSYTNTNVTVTLTATDNLSGVAQTMFTVDGGADAGRYLGDVVDGRRTHTLTYYSVDNAGNVETAHVVTVRIDKTAPTITAAKAPPRTGPAGTRRNVTVTFTCSDSGSGIASCTAPQTRHDRRCRPARGGYRDRQRGQHGADDGDGEHRQDAADDHRDAERDRRTPTVGSRRRLPASFACSDALSGLASCTGAVTFGRGCEPVGDRYRDRRRRQHRDARRSVRSTSTSRSRRSPRLPTGRPTAVASTPVR